MLIFKLRGEQMKAQNTQFGINRDCKQSEVRFESWYFESCLLVIYAFWLLH